MFHKVLLCFSVAILHIFTSRCDAEAIFNITAATIQNNDSPARKVNLTDKDFNCTISDITFTITISKLAKEIETTIAPIIANVIHTIVLHFQHLEANLTENSINDLADQYVSVCSYLLGVKQQLEKSNNFTDFIERKIPEMSNKWNVTFGASDISNLTKYKNLFECLPNVSDHSLAPSWSKGFAELESLDTSKRWYIFYCKIYYELDSYQTQKNHQKYNHSEFTTTLDRLLADSTLTEFSLQKIGLKEFLTQFPAVERAFNLLPNMTINRFRAENMLKTVKAFLEYEVQALPLIKNLLIRGRYVVFSDVMNHLTNETFKTIEIFATKAVFIDASLNRTGTLDQLAIIAPQWQIVTSGWASISIILNGANGQPPVGADGQPLGRARDGQSVEKPDGEDGKPGNTGSTAGNVVGLGATFVSNHKLSIFVSGGHGSSGQDGGNGFDGRDGQSPQNLSVSITSPGHCRLQYNDDEINGNTFKCETAGCPMKWDTNHIDSFFCCGGILHASLNSTDGGNAGDGGAAGGAGKHGTVKVVMLPTEESPTYLSVTAQNGSIGKPGSSGSPGKAAKINAYDLNPIFLVTTTYIRKTSSGGKTYEDRSQICETKSYQHISVPGEPGKSGGEIPSLETKPLINLDVIVTRYKEFIRKELTKISGSLLESFPREFLKYLETSPTVAEWYNADMIKLAADLQILESQYFEYANQVSPPIFISNYRFFQDRVRVAANSFNGSRDQDFKSKFSSLNAAAMAMITALNYRTSNSLIIDITSYLDLLLERIKEYKNFKTYVKKANLQDQFQQQIKHSIEEAHNMVLNFLNTEIDKIFGQLNDDAAQLITDVARTAKEAQKQAKQLKEQREKLKNSMLSVGILSAVESCSTLLGFLGLIGDGISAVIKGGTEIGKKVVSVDALENLSTLPSSTTIAAMTDRLRREGLAFKDRLSEGITILEKAKTFHKEVRDLKEEFQAAKKTIEEEEKKNLFNSVAPDIVQLVRQTLRQKLEECGTTTKHADIKDLCAQLQIIIDITADFVDIYNKVKPAGTGELAELDEAIQEAEKSSYQLNRLKKAIYADTLPLFENIHTNVNSLADRLQHDSHASLAVSKWNVQQTLDNVIHMLDSMSTVFNITEDMAACVKKVEQGTSLIIDIYDTIQDYEDQSQMVRYIYDMSSTDLGQIANTSVRSVVDNMTTLVETNIILGEFFNAMSNIKPYVFPFPTYFLGNVYSLPIPSSSEAPQFGSAQLEQMLNAVSQNITRINSKIKKDQLEVKGEYDQYIRKSNFKRSKSRSPFYTWNYHLGLVKRLLRGETVTVTAKVQDQIKNAVKFKEIGIYMRIQSATGNMTAEEVEAQKDLDSKLQAYIVYMTHMGVSYFRCDDTFYMMHTNDDLTFSYSFEKDEKGEPADKNNVYDKVSQGVYVLSPYTTWQIRLEPAKNYATNKATLLKQSAMSSTSASTESLNKSVASQGSAQLFRVPSTQAFSEFEPFLNRTIILELEGKGQYVDPKGASKICARERVSEYYTKVRSLM